MKTCLINIEIANKRPQKASSTHSQREAKNDDKRSQKIARATDITADTHLPNELQNKGEAAATGQQNQLPKQPHKTTKNNSFTHTKPTYF